MSVQSVENFELRNGEPVNAMCNESVIDVACIKETCNKSVSDAGQVRSVGRLDNRSIGARSAARALKEWLKPYAT